MNSCFAMARMSKPGSFRILPALSPLCQRRTLLLRVNASSKSQLAKLDSLQLSVSLILCLSRCMETKSSAFRFTNPRAEGSTSHGAEGSGRSTETHSSTTGTLSAHPQRSIATSQTAGRLTRGDIRVKGALDHLQHMTLSIDPAAVVQRQLEAYYARDVDALLATYAEDAQIAKAWSIVGEKIMD